jgi:tartrate dehydratase alpha subunit/fumarate hydratase class I-like protein
MGKEIEWKKIIEIRKAIQSGVYITRKKLLVTADKIASALSEEQREEDQSSPSTWQPQAQTERWRRK